MKKFLAGLLVGHITTSFAMMYITGGYKRGVDFLTLTDETDRPFKLAELMDYMIWGKVPVDVNLVAEEDVAHTARLMKRADNDDHVIAAYLGITLKELREILDS